MQKRSSTGPGKADVSHLALLERLSHEVQSQEENGLSAEVRHLIAVALGRQGGLKGGKARAKKLSSKTRSAIAKKAAEARWGPRRKK